MSRPSNRSSLRILVIDDNPAIHDDYRKILCGKGGGGAVLEEAEAALFGIEQKDAADEQQFVMDDAFQGEEGLVLVQKALREGRPYVVAFVDMRMPPGWDGLETIARIWKEDPHLEVVICTAHSDHSWQEMTTKLGLTDRWMIIKKPFDNIEVRQIACSLSEKWNLAQESRRRMDDLERAVLDRTQEIEKQRDHLEEALAQLQEAHAQLLQADKMASIGQLAAGVAHEINNPIGFISSNLNSLEHYAQDIKNVLDAHEALLEDCLQNRPNLAASAQHAKTVREQNDINYILSDIGDLIAESIEGTQRVRQIVADLRDFSHVDAPDLKEEDVNMLLDKMVNVAWNELKYKTEVVRQYGSVAAVSCYGGKLGQVFLNLLVNAAQAIETHGTITLRTGQDGDRVWIEVEDTGCGIPPNNLKRVFDPFFTTKEVGKGTGMGLHLAYKIVALHNGRIDVASTPGKGTTFRVELPVAGPSRKETQGAPVA